jgi:hypothetical protein
MNAAVLAVGDPLCGLCAAQLQGVGQTPNGFREIQRCVLCSDETRGVCRSLASGGPVSLVDHGNICLRCGRAMNINEPVYRDAGGGIRCNACNDVVPEPAERPRAPLPAPSEMVTSVLLQRAASILDGYGVLGNREDRIIAHELRLRAAMLQRQSQWVNECADRDCDAPATMATLRAIGEVRS